MESVGWRWGREGSWGGGGLAWLSSPIHKHRSGVGADLPAPAARQPPKGLG